MYTVDEIISSISDKAIDLGFSEAPSDTVDARQYLHDLYGTDAIRIRRTTLPLGVFRILQPRIEFWRYLRLCSLRPSQFEELVRLKPIIVVRGPMILGYPLLQGNHRALYAHIHGITELPASVCLLSDEDAAFSFARSAQEFYNLLDLKFGRHDVGALGEGYKRLLAQVVHLRKRQVVFLRGDNLFSTRTAQYRRLRDENHAISQMIPCISLDSYLKTLGKMFRIRRADLRLAHEPIFFRGLMMTQKACEREKLKRISENPRLLEAPIVVARTRELDYVVVGHTRLRAHCERGVQRCQAILIHVENDRLNHFLDQQALLADHLHGNEGIRRMDIID